MGHRQAMCRSRTSFSRTESLPWASTECRAASTWTVRTEYHAGNWRYSFQNYFLRSILFQNYYWSINLIFLDSFPGPLPTLHDRNIDPGSTTLLPSHQTCPVHQRNRNTAWWLHRARLVRPHALIITEALFSSKKFTQYSSHQIFGHRVLNTVEKITNYTI